VTKEAAIGSIGWVDLTVPDAERIRDFYAQVVGWKPSPVSMGGYEDFNMNSPSHDTPCAGICHARGANADLPAQWLVYIVVKDIAASIARCTELGGSLLAGPKRVGQSHYCVIRDPAGAVCALFQP
jgi:predicted enzyme related to lactoylglutathione lyase